MKQVMSDGNTVPYIDATCTILRNALPKPAMSEGNTSVVDDNDDRCNTILNAFPIPDPLNFSPLSPWNHQNCNEVDKFENMCFHEITMPIEQIPLSIFNWEMQSEETRKNCSSTFKPCPEWFVAENMTHVSAMFPEIQHTSEQKKTKMYSERITQKRTCLAEEIWNEEKLCIFNKFSTEVFGINVSKPVNVKMLFDIISENEAFVFETKHYKELGKLMWGFGIPALKQMRSHCCRKILSNNQVQFDGEFFGMFRNIITVKRKELRKQVNRRMAKYGMKLSQKSIEDQHEIKISYNDNSVFYVTFTEQQSSTKETISTSSHIDTTSGSVRDVLTMEDCDRKIFIDLEKKTW